MKNGISSDPKLQPKLNETEQEKVERLNLASLHFNGCLEFISSLYMIDKGKIVDDKTFTSLQIGLLSKEM